MNTYEEKKKANRLSQAKYRNSEKGKEYYAKYRAEHHDEYLVYQREQAKKRKEMKNNVSSN